MFVEQLDVVYNRFQPDQRVEKSNKTQNVLTSITRIYIVGHCIVKGLFGSDLSEGQQHQHYRAIRVQ